jgi:hypothetical protein
MCVEPAAGGIPRNVRKCERPTHAAATGVIRASDQTSRPCTIGLRWSGRREGNTECRITCREEHTYAGVGDSICCRLGSRSVVIIQQSAETFTSLQLPAFRDEVWIRADQLFAEALVVAFAVVMDAELAGCATNRAFAKKNQSLQANSALIVRTNRSAYAFKFGASGRQVSRIRRRSLRSLSGTRM